MMLGINMIGKWGLQVNMGFQKRLFWISSKSSGSSWAMLNHLLLKYY